MFKTKLTFDLEVDIPRSVASKTASHHSDAMPLLVFLVESLNWQFFITNHQGYEPGLALPAWLIADNLLFLTWILVVFRNHSPCRNCAFSSSVPEFLIKLTYFPTHVLHLKTSVMFWNMKKSNRTPGGEWESGATYSWWCFTGTSTLPIMAHLQVLLHIVLCCNSPTSEYLFIHLKLYDRTPQ